MVSAESVELAVQDKQGFVAVVVQVRWRGEAGRYPVIEDAQLAVALVAADLGDGQGAEEPVWLSLVGCDDKALAGVQVWFSGFTAVSLCGGRAVIPAGWLDIRGSGATGAGPSSGAVWPVARERLAVPARAWVSAACRLACRG